MSILLPDERDRSRVLRAKGRRFSIKWILLIGILVLIWGIWSIMLEARSAKTIHGFSVDAFSSLPISAVSVNDERIAYGDVILMARAIQYVKPDLSDEEAFHQAVDQLMSHAAVRQLARDLGVSYTSSVADIVVPEPFSTPLNWSAAEYAEFVVSPLELSQATERVLFDNEGYQQAVYDELLSILDEQEFGVQFKDLAFQHSEDISASGYGFLGYLEQDELDPVMVDMFDASIGDQSDVLDLEDAFGVVRVADVVEIEGVRVQVALQLIALKKMTLDEVIEQYLAESTIDYWVDA